MSDQSVLLTIAVLGGTGREGKGLAYRWAKAGYRVLIGSRDDQKAVSTAAGLVQLFDGTASVVGMLNQEAAAAADIVVMAVPYAAHGEILGSIASAL